MISRLGLAISRVFQRTVPDPFVIAIVLTLLTAVLALTVGDLPGKRFGDRCLSLLDAWWADDGLWYFLKFAMQMSLILVTGYALAATPAVHALIGRLANAPRSTAQAAALVGLVACLAGLLNWGLGLIVGALLARDVGRSLQRRGIRAHYPLICAAGYMGLLVWHGGLSGSAPLSMTTETGARAVLPAAYVAQSVVPLDETIGSRLNLFVSGGLIVIVPLFLYLLAPKQPGALRPIGDFKPVDDQVDDGPPRNPTVPDRLDRSLLVALLLAVPLVLGLIRYVQLRGLARLDLNTVIMAMFALGLILQGSPRAYMEAVTQGARGCAGIIIQFPLYAGIMAMMQESNLVTMIAQWFDSIGNQTTIPLLSFVSAGVVNLLVPSGGGQWGIQGPIALEMGVAAGIAPGKMIMAVSFGDELTNMLQPFWALPLLAITGVRARDIVGYTALVMIVAAVWMALGLLIL
jgi:short-chain fatty acids transporter